VRPRGQGDTSSLLHSCRSSSSSASSTRPPSSWRSSWLTPTATVLLRPPLSRSHPWTGPALRASWPPTLGARDTRAAVPRRGRFSSQRARCSISACPLHLLSSTSTFCRPAPRPDPAGCPACPAESHARLGGRRLSRCTRNARGSAQVDSQVNPPPADALSHPSHRCARRLSAPRGREDEVGLDTGPRAHAAGTRRARACRALPAHPWISDSIQCNVSKQLQDVQSARGPRRYCPSARGADPIGEPPPA